uniref:Interferon regulatory factor-3 domain-containing protein n=1 Tax=Anas zonorhyncha TaxID=75864 RepID=A0A8B9UZA5_9AVES
MGSGEQCSEASRGQRGCVGPCAPAHPTHKSKKPPRGCTSSARGTVATSNAPTHRATGARSPQGSGQAAWARPLHPRSHPASLGAPRFFPVPPGSSPGRERGDPGGSVGSPEGTRGGAQVPRGRWVGLPAAQSPQARSPQGGVPSAHRCPWFPPHPSRGRDPGGAAEEPKAASGKTKAKVPNAPSLSPPRRAPEGTAGQGRTRGSGRDGGAGVAHEAEGVADCPNRQRPLPGAALGGRPQDAVPHPLEARGQAGLPAAAGRGALQENDGGPQPPAGEDPQGRAAGSPAEEGVRGAGGSCHAAALPLLSAHPAERGYHIRGAFYGWNPTHGHFLPRPPSYLPVEDVNHSDCWLHVRLYYCDVLVKELTTRTAEGCRIASRAEPAESERLYGPSCMEQIEFPPPRALGGSSRVAGVTEVLERLLPHLERGVLLWVAPEGVFMKRQCQGRVYWNGPLAPHRDWPNKLEREKTYKLLDTQQFLQQLRRYLSQGQPAPQYQIHLCFGEEYPTSASHHFQKLIMAHVEPVFARELFHHAQRIGPTLLRDCPQPCAPGAPGHIVHVLQQLCQP